MTSWTWDVTLYEGSAAYYGDGRMAYPPLLAEVIREQTSGDRIGGRLLDVGCGPGSLTLLLAPHFIEVIGVDADPGMVAEARRRATVDNVTWRQLRAEELPADLGSFDVVTFAQSFHWMDQPLVAERVRGMLNPGGFWVHVFATTHQGVPGDDPLPRPRPPWDAVEALVAEYVGPGRRAGQGMLAGGTKAGEEDVMRAAGYVGPTRVDVGGGEVVERTVDEIVASVFSLSGSAPHLFGDRLSDFEADLRALLADGPYAERRREIRLVIWRRR
jgi:SAM-dependent methyltransferase